jgi:signal transduction histidine kinase
VLATDGLAGAIAGGTLAILALALLGVALDRWMQGRLRQEQAHRRLWQEAEAAREAAVRAAAEAEAANRARSDFLATMSHELRTPLNAIGGYVELLALGLYGPVSAEQQATFERVQRAQRHLLGLINDVLNFAKLEAGSVTYVAEDVSVTRVLEDVHAILAPQFALAGVAYDDHQARCHAVLRADREKVQQILLNLLGNAVKFTPSGGQVTITCAAQHEAVLLRVRDTGIGIPADKLEAVFQPFVQVGAGLTREHGGTGLGLAISRDLARAMGGDLTVESAPGVGSTFTLTLRPTSEPRLPEPGRAGARPEEPQDPPLVVA